ncbi:MAG: hypothetical protein ACFFG0_02935 [Candidatus Thorarchaeota archaeon]
MKFKENKLIMELSKSDLNKLFNMGCIFEIKKGEFEFLEDIHTIILKELKGGLE